MESNSITEVELWAYVSKTADTSTKLKIEQWIQSSEYDEQLFTEIESIYVATGNHSNHNTSTELAKERFYKTIDNEKVQSFNWKNVFKYAAIIVFVLTTSIIGYQKFSSNTEQILVQTTFGEQKKIDLSDGSVVWLNASSRLSYLKTSPRTIYLEGEAFFEVAKDSEHPFIVSTKDQLNVEALGTSFNVKSYSKNLFTETVLFTGRVEITSNKHFKNKIIMLPNDKVIFFRNSKKIVKSKAEFMTSTIAWKEGKIEFKNKSFKEIANDLSIQFNIKISFKNKQISNYKFTGSFDKSTPIGEILETLKLSKHFAFEKVDGNKWIIK